MTLAIIPARGGSKGIPGKNIREIGGKPLIAWTIEAARLARQVSRVVVSTEDPAIAEVARAWGAEVPFVRPPELATDEAPGIGPVLHAVGQLPGHDTVILLQPTSPLRDASHIDALLAFAAARKAVSVVSVSPVEEHPAWMFRLRDDTRLKRYSRSEDAARRQDLPQLYTLNGAMYFVRTEWLLSERALVGDNTLGYVMDAEVSVDIDTLLDWRLAELLLIERGGGTS